MIPGPRFSPRSWEKTQKNEAPDFFVHLSLLVPILSLYLALILYFRPLYVTVCMCKFRKELSGMVWRTRHRVHKKCARQRQISASLTVFGQDVPLRGAPSYRSLTTSALTSPRRVVRPFKFEGSPTSDAIFVPDSRPPPPVAPDRLFWLISFWKRRHLRPIATRTRPIAQRAGRPWIRSCRPST